jgi:hypothetical protein
MRRHRIGTSTRAIRAGTAWLAHLRWVAEQGDPSFLEYTAALTDSGETLATIVKALA